jgi:hypothetical protein
VLVLMRRGCMRRHMVGMVMSIVRIVGPIRMLRRPRGTVRRIMRWRVRILWRRGRWIIITLRCRSAGLGGSTVKGLLSSGGQIWGRWRGIRRPGYGWAAVGNGSVVRTGLGIIVIGRPCVLWFERLRCS